MYPTFWRKAGELEQVFENACRATKIHTDDMNDWASRVTLDMIGLATLGHDFAATGGVQTPELKAYLDFFSPTFASIVSWGLGSFVPMTWLRQIPLLNRTGLWRSVRIARRISAEMIASRRDQTKYGNSEAKETSIENFNIISRSIETNAFTDAELSDHVMTMITAGHDTTSATLIWTIYSLCKNQIVQDRLRQEIHTANLPVDSSFTATDVSSRNLPYLHAVLKEVFRLYPAIPTVTRIALKDTTLLGHKIPVGTTVMSCPWALGASKDLWGPDALEFNPDRWIVSNDSDRPRTSAKGGAVSNYAFSTFSYGPRNCIGQQIARAELECLVARLVGRFRFSLTDEDLRKPVMAGGIIVAKPIGSMNVSVSEA